MEIQITEMRLGARFAGRCPACGQMTGRKDYQLADTVVGKRSDGAYAVLHASCAGWRTWSKVGGAHTGSGPSSMTLETDEGGAR